jgi:hypothetical protein
MHLKELPMREVPVGEKGPIAGTSAPISWLQEVSE